MRRVAADWQKVAAAEAESLGHAQLLPAPRAVNIRETTKE